MFRLRFTGFAAGREHLVLGRPELLREVFTGDPDIYLAGTANQIIEPLVGPNALIVTDGPAARWQRSVIFPAFHGKAINARRERIRDIATKHITQWPTHTPFALLPRLRALILDVILDVLFRDLNSPRIGRLRSTIPTLLDTGRRLGLLPEVRRRLMPFGAQARFERLLEECDTTIYDIVRDRRTQTSDGDDVVGLLLEARHDSGAGLSDHEMRDNLMSLITAGHESTATACCWAFECLMRAPRYMDRIQRELAGGQSTYLEAAVKESLRLFPAFPFTLRKAAQEVTLGNLRVRKDTILMCSAYLAHRSPDYFPNPTAYTPERFLPRFSPKESAMTGWMPFGDGARRCIGAGLALAEIRTILRSALTAYDLRPASRRPERVRRVGVLIAPSRGAMAIASPRSAG